MSAHRKSPPRWKDPARGLVLGHPPDWFPEDIEIFTGREWVPLDSGTVPAKVIMFQIREMVRFAVARALRERKVSK